MEPGADQAAKRSEGPQMTQRRLLTCGAWIYALLMAGCGGKILYPHYYTLEIPPAPKATETAPRQPATVAVRRFEMPAYLRQGRIVYRQAPAEIGFCEYHRWASDPGAMVTTAIFSRKPAPRTLLTS